MMSHDTARVASVERSSSTGRDPDINMVSCYSWSLVFCQARGHLSSPALSTINYCEGHINLREDPDPDMGFVFGWLT